MTTDISRITGVITMRTTEQSEAKFPGTQDVEKNLEAQRDVLAQVLIDFDECPHFLCDDDSEWCVYTAYYYEAEHIPDFKCRKDSKAKIECWIKYAAQEAAKRGA